MYFLYPFSLDAFGRRTRSHGPGDDGALERSIEEPRDRFRSYLSDHRSRFCRGEAAIALRDASFFEPWRATWGFPEPRKADIRAIRNRPGPRPSPAPRPTLTSSIFTPALFSRFFETVSFRPPLSDQEMPAGPVPPQQRLDSCIEFESADKAHADSRLVRLSTPPSTRAIRRYWVMWKLPMRLPNPEEVLSGIRACTSAFPDCFSASPACNSSGAVLLLPCPRPAGAPSRLCARGRLLHGWRLRCGPRAPPAAELLLVNPRVCPPVAMTRDGRIRDFQRWE